MLKRFLYLDTAALGDYVSAIEDGMRQSMSKTTVSEASDAETAASFSDTPQAQFERLLRMARSEPSIAKWIEINESDPDFNSAGIGFLISARCDLDIPQVSRILSSSGGFVEAMEQMEAIAPFVTMFEPQATAEMPSREQRDAMKGFVGALNGKAIVVGELEHSDVKLAGQLQPEHLRGDVEGTGYIVGKISHRWEAGQWKPLLALPGSSLLPREQRRRLERTKPAAEDRDKYLEGPALMLDILAIYR